MEVLASGAALAAAEVVAEQSAGAQQTAVGPVTLNWLGNDTPRLATGVTWGVPFARGTVSKTQTFSLASADGKALPLQTWPLAYWPDGTMKFVGFATVAAANTGGAFRMAPGPVANVGGPAIALTQTAAAVNIDTGAIQCTIPKTGPDFIGSIRIEGREVGGRAACSAPRKIAPCRERSPSTTI